MTESSQEKLEQLAANTIRMLAVDAVEKANSGHPSSFTGSCATIPTSPIGRGGIASFSPRATDPCCFTRCCTCTDTSSPWTI